MLTVHCSEEVEGLRSRWLRVCFSQSFRGQPVRPLLRLHGAARTQDHILPAAVLGRARWIGPAPADLARVEILAELSEASAFRIDSIRALTDMQVGVTILRRRPALLPGFLLPFLDTPRGRMLRVQAALDYAALDDPAPFVASRTRPPEPSGLDAVPDSSLLPSLGLVIAAKGGDEEALLATLESLAGQVDGGCQVQVAAADGPSAERISRAVAECAVHVAVEDVSGRSGEGLDHAALRLAGMSRHDWVGLLRPGDRVAPYAVLVLRDFLASHPELHVLYTDSSTLGRSDRTAALQLKPDWSPSFLQQVDYVGRLCLFRTSVLEAAAGMVADNDAHPWWSALRIAGQGRSPAEIGHLKRLLVARRAKPSHAPRPVPAIMAPGVRATILVPTRDRLDLLRRAVESVLEKTPAGTFDLLVIDNETQEPEALAYLSHLAGRPGVEVLEDPGPFNFSRIVNAGAARARGEVLVLLNNDCEALDGSWLAAMTSLAAQPDVGAVGAKLLYENGLLQHAGVGLGLGGEAGHRDRKMPADHPGHLGRLLAVHEVSAVTGACLAVERRKFMEIGGFDPSFAVAFNDVDFCLRLQARRYRNLLTPEAVLRHAESASRGQDQGSRRARFLDEAARFRERWLGVILDDPFFHPLLSTNRFPDLLG